MRKLIFLIPIIIISLFQTACNQGTNVKKPLALEPEADTNSVPDTGFTGIRRFYSKNTLTYETTLKNGVRQGLMKSYYPSGKTRQTFWYVNGMKEDTAVWFYEEGPIFRKTPFKRDSMNGTQIQYYMNGALRAKISFINGLRTPELEEFKKDGQKITDYPNVVIRTKDNYKTNGTFEIYTELDRKNIKAAFYRGEFTNGVFNPKGMKKFNVSDFSGHLKLSKSTPEGTNTVGIISEITTSLGNKLLVYKQVPLPYSDLK